MPNLNAGPATSELSTASLLETATFSRRSFLKNALIMTTGSLAVVKWGAKGVLAQNAVGSSSKPTLYLVATAHNDTQWNWTVQNTIKQYIPSTMRPNWELMRKYPDYNFNYEASIHYAWFKEYHLEDWKELQDWVAKGRWKLSGGWVNAVDVVIPSPESLFRQALYGQAFFRREFGQVPRDVYLPDCFGFPYSLPTIARHSGLTSFSSQKFDLWGGFRPAPFSVGRWEGVDGSQIVASLRCKAYDTHISSDVSTDPKWTNDFADAGDRQINMRYFGTGDRGGTPDEASVQWMEKAVNNKDGIARVINTSAQQLANDLTPAQIAALPVYKDELLLTDHGAGCLTSQAAMKKWNRANELLADSAEKVAMAAHWLGAAPYPRQVLNEAWLRFLWHQFHDDLTGTSIPQAYTFSWNDELLSLNQFAGVLNAGISGITRSLNTRVKGTPLAVYNPLDQPRHEVVKATVPRTGEAFEIRVFDPETGGEVLSEIIFGDDYETRFKFLAEVPAVGVKIYDVRQVTELDKFQNGLKAKASYNVTNRVVENSKLKVELNDQGDIVTLLDKTSGQQLLNGPATLQYFHDVSTYTPAWEVKWDVIGKPPQGLISDDVKITQIEGGDLHGAVQVKRTLGDTIWIQQIRLNEGQDWVDVENIVTWRSPGKLVKAAFPLAVSNPIATFDMGLGVIERPNADSKRHEVPAQNWADLTDSSGRAGLAILTSTKYGFDKPTDSMLRLTLLRSPDANVSYQYQETNDIGFHRFTYGLAPHAGDWREADIQGRAARFNQPMRAFIVPQHAGRGRSLSLASVSSNQVMIRALKLAEESDEWIIRLNEMNGKAIKGVRVKLAAPITSAREINAAEEAVGPYAVSDGELKVDFTAFQPRSFAVKVARSARRVQAPQGQPVELPFNLNGVTNHFDLSAADFTGAGDSFAAELWPTGMERDGVTFKLGKVGAPNFVVCRGQTINLPRGSFTKAVFLATSINGDHVGEFKVDGGASQKLRVADWAQHIGQWDSRLANPSQGGGGGQIVKEVVDGRVQDVDRLFPSYLKRDRVAWVGTHRHYSGGDQIYLFSYLFQMTLDLTRGARQITLPDNSNIRIAALTLANDTFDDTRSAGEIVEPHLGTGVKIPAIVPRPPAGTRVFGPSDLQFFDGKSGVTHNEAALLALPTLANEPWTISLFVYLEEEPKDHTLMAGFGDARDQTGAQRYLGRVRGGIEFWGSNVNIDSGLPFDIGKWQMISATFDGKAVTVFKNGQAAISQPADLSDAAPEVKLAPSGTWNRENRFTGRIAGLSIWNSALTGAQIENLWKDRPSN